MGDKVLFDSTKEKNITHEPKTKRLEECPIIKCAPDEKILCVQRQHPITLIVPMLMPVLIALFVLSSLFFVPIFFPQMIPFALYNTTLPAYIMATTIVIVLVVETFNFMNWYYQFYVITNKAIIHRHCFRIGGEYSEVVFGEKMHVQDMVRIPQNVIYDFLKIQDVYVYFHKLEREEPFIFKTPEDAQIIEDLIQDLVTQANHTKGKT